MKFDYEAVAGAVAQIGNAISSVNAAISDKIPSTTYVSGNAKEAVDAYIEQLNNCFNPIVPELEAIKSKIEEVKTAYLTAESGINSSLNGAAAGNAASGESRNSNYVN